MIELTAQIIGHLGADAKLVTSEKGNFVSFPVYADLYEGQILKGVPQIFEITTNRLNLQPYLKKGTRVYVTGAARVEIAPTKGNNGFKLGGRCVARHVELISPAKGDIANEGFGVATPTPEPSEGVEEETITYSEDAIMEDIDNNNYFG